MNPTPVIARLQRMNKGSVFRAFTLRGDEMAQPIDPFLGVDHAWISGPTFPPHPHAGFSAVSYLFLDSETGVASRDSTGNRSIIPPGGLHWMAAGRGVVHEEAPVETGKTVHMLQIFVNLATERQGAAPFSLSLAPQDTPLVQLPGVRIRVPLGSFGEHRSPLTPPTEVTLLDIDIDEGSTLTLPVSAGNSAFVMPIFGTVTINDAPFHSDEPRLPAFPAQPEGHTLTLRSTLGKAKVMLFAGPPLQQPVYWQGPLALSSAAALAVALASYQQGEFGAL